MAVRVSTIICTHNRANYLQKAIQSLIEQTLPKDQHEIIVVDNGSTDNTKQIVKDLIKTNNLKTTSSNLKYIYEPLLGLSRARNTGWQASRGEYIAFLDDDAVAAPDWAQRIIEEFESFTPTLGAIGGKVEPLWESERPEWLSDGLLPQLSVLDWGPQTIILNEEQWFVGANMSFPRKILEKTNGFSTMLGRKESNLLSMEENLIRKETEKRGYKCLYSPRIVVKHHILKSRLNKKWFIKRAYWNGVSSAIIQIHQGHLSVVKRFLKGGATLLRILLSPRELFCLFSPLNDSVNFNTSRSVMARLGHVMMLFGVIKIPK